MNSSETYRQLHYRADVSYLRPDSLTGHDCFGHPYRVVGADFDGSLTTVVLTHARPEDIWAAEVERNTKAAEYDRIRALFGAAS